MTDATHPEPGPVQLAEVETIIDGAARNGTPVAVSYVDEGGRPRLSPRGTVQVHGATQLALWARTPGLPAAVAVNPDIALLYQDLAQRTVLMFSGRARVTTDGATRDQIFEKSPVSEQAQDPDRRGWHSSCCWTVAARRGGGSAGRVGACRGRCARTADRRLPRRRTPDWGGQRRRWANARRLRRRAVLDNRHRRWVRARLPDAAQRTRPGSSHPRRCPAVRDRIRLPTPDLVGHADRHQSARRTTPPPDNRRRSYDLSDRSTAKLGSHRQRDRNDHRDRFHPQRSRSGDRLTHSTLLTTAAAAMPDDRLRGPR